jgi:hypothetical protein
VRYTTEAASECFYGRWLGRLWERERARASASPGAPPASVTRCLFAMLRWRLLSAMCMVALWVAGGLVGPVVMERLTERLETTGAVEWD